MTKPKAIKSRSIKALFFREPYDAIEWKWYNTKSCKYEKYANDTQQRLEFEAAYYANIQSNFPISNKLFRSKQGTSIFDCCFLPRFTKLLKQAKNYCLSFTLFSISDDDDFELTIDQVCIQSGYQRTVRRDFNRQTYLSSSLKRNMAKFNILSSKRLAGDAVAWMAVFDHKDKFHLTITGEHDKNKNSQFSFKTKKASIGFNHTYVKIQDCDLMTNKCKKWKWAKFKRRGARYCRSVAGYWAMSFHNDANYNQLREHLDAIFSALQKNKIQKHFGIDTENGMFLHEDMYDEETKEQISLTVTIDDKKYDILWYNARPLERAHAICIKPLVENKKLNPMYIMYYERDETMKFQWYDNDVRQYKNYTEDNELLQLECSYLSNLDENFPHNVIERIESDRKDRTRFFSHVIFSEFNKNQKINMKKKLYVIRHQVVEEEADDLILEQVAYTNNSHFPRTIRRINLKVVRAETEIELFVPVVENEINEIDKMPTFVIQKSIAMTNPNVHINRSSAEDTLESVTQRLTDVMVQYQEWIQSKDKKEGMLPNLAQIYNVDAQKKQKKAVTLLRDDFKKFKTMIENKGDPFAENEFTNISRHINSEVAQLGHQSTNCICVQRNHQERRDRNYFGFAEKIEIITQQLLDAYHCELVHLYDDNYAKNEFKSMSSIDITQLSDTTIVIEDHDDMNDIPETRPQLDRHASRVRQSSLFQHLDKSKNIRKFNTAVYDTGFRFYYWPYYQYNAGNKRSVSYRDETVEPGNKKQNGKNYKLKDWYIDPAAKDFKEEILAFGDNFGDGDEKSAEKNIQISLDQYKEAYGMASLHLTSEECKRMKCDDAALEEQYGINLGSVIKLHHILAIILYCSFSDVCSEFCGTFRRINASESDKSVKQRHSKCAVWGKYLRECVEVFGLKLKRNNNKVAQTYYRGIGKKFLFKRTILRFNAPMSTTVNADMANAFANSSMNNDGMVLTLRPHWGDYPGNIRAFKCDTFSDRPYEREYLFIGGLEPLVILNIVELKTGTPYRDKIQAMNNIHQIFEGMACKFPMKPLLMNKFIDNRLKQKNQSYMSQLFDEYCNGLKQIMVRLGMMKKSYIQIKDSFLEMNNNMLRLSKIIKLFPNCEKITVCDGYDYPMIPISAKKMEDTIFGSVLSALGVITKNHPLKLIKLKANRPLKNTISAECKLKLVQFGWRCKSETIEDDDRITTQYEITKNVNEKNANQ